MKYKELANTLRKMGWSLKRQGGSHEIWTDGERTIAVPRHREINEITAKGIMALAKKRGRNNVD